MTDGEPALQIVDEAREHRFEARLDGALVGFAEYRLRPERIVFVHTEVDDAMAGRGVGSRLVTFALDAARSRGLGVVAQCPFVARYITDHPAYHDLLVAGERPS